MPVLSRPLIAGRSRRRRAAGTPCDAHDDPEPAPAKPRRSTGWGPAEGPSSAWPEDRASPSTRTEHPGPASRRKPDRPGPQSQSLSRGYGSNLPTSLTYIVLSTRGCSPWRPAADMGTDRRERCIASVRIFKGRRECSGHRRKRGALRMTTSLSPGEPIPGSTTLKKKRELFPGLPATSPDEFALPRDRPLREESGPSPRPGSGILTRFPFDRTASSETVKTHRLALGTEFPYLLGPTDPCPTAVHMEPFSTSVFKVLV